MVVTSTRRGEASATRPAVLLRQIRRSAGVAEALRVKGAAAAGASLLVFQCCNEGDVGMAMGSPAHVGSVGVEDRLQTVAAGGAARAAERARAEHGAVSARLGTSRPRAMRALSGGTAA